MIKDLLYILISIFFLFSCRPKKDNSITTRYGPQVVEAHGYVISADSIIAPLVIQVDESKLKKIKAGKPKVIPTNTNTFPAGIPNVVTAGIPRVCIPGQDSFALPVIVPAIDSPFLAGIPRTAIAKDPAVKDQNPQNFSSFNRLQGLSSSDISCMIQDKNGNIWFCGRGGGVSRYDGKSFTYFNEKEGLSNQSVLSILQDKDGNIWFGTDRGGLSKYDGKHFTHFTIKEGLADNSVYSILQDKNGALWFGTQNGGVSKYDGKYFTHFTSKEGLSNNFVYAMLEDNNGDLWFGTYGGGASKYDGKSFTHFTKKEGLCSNEITSILEDKNGNLWFGTDGAGISKYDGKYFTNYTVKEGLSNNFVLSMLQDYNGNFWFGTYGTGVTMYNGKSFIRFSEKEGLRGDVISSMLQDKNGNLWFGTYGSGVSRFDGRLFTHFSETEGFSNKNVTGILQDKNGNLWFSTNDDGLYMYDGKSFSHFTEQEGLSNNVVLCMLQDKKGNIWFGTNGNGVSKYDGKSFISFNENVGITNNFIYCLLQDQNDNMWFGTYGGGAFKYDGKSITNYSLREGLVNTHVLSMVQDNSGNIWFGTYGGISKLHGKSFTNYTVKNGLNYDFVGTIVKDNNENLWFGNNGGLSKYDGNSFTYFTEKEGLSNNFVKSILQDKIGNIWIGTRAGLNKLSNKKLDEISVKITTGALAEQDIIFKTYTYDDGFLGIGCNKDALYEATDGTIWIGANSRLTAFYPEGETEDTIAPSIQLTGLDLFNENIGWANLLTKKDSTLILGNGIKVRQFQFDSISRWYGVPENLKLGYNNNNLIFNFIGITMNQSKRVKYQYKLEGIDENWSAITTRNEAPYGNLPPRDYIFKVKSMNSEGYWSNELQYPFTIRSPWWATSWMYSLYILSVGGMVYFFYRLRIHQFKEKQIAQIKAIVATQEAERSRISRDLHDDVGTKLSALKLFISSLREKASGTNHEEIRSLAASSEQFITEAMQDVRLLLLNLSPTVLEEFGYTTAVEGLIRKLNETKQIHFNLTVFGMKQRMQKDYELALYRMTQELINNVLKHAQAKNVSLQIGQRDEKIILMIEDDGRGFDVSEHKGGYGLQNLEARTKLLHGSIVIDSTVGKGTSVLIEIPYRTKSI